MDPLRAVKGMNDILPNESAQWQRVEAAFRRTSALYGFREVRTPFLDHRLVERMFTVPPELKIHEGDTKHLLKQVARRYLPEELITRPKEGFVEPAVYWIGNELADLCKAYLLGESFDRRGLLDHAYVKDLVDRFYRDRDFTIAKRVWNLFMFAMWEAHGNA